MLIALIASACSSSRQTAVSDVSRFRAQELRDSVKVEKVVVEVHDTVMETTTIVVDRNEAGDTLKLSTVTERDRIRDRAQVMDQHERIVVKTDTVFVAVRDSSYVQNTNYMNGTNKKSNFVSALKWIFGILVCVIVLVLIFNVKRFV